MHKTKGWIQDFHGGGINGKGKNARWECEGSLPFFPLLWIHHRDAPTITISWSLSNVEVKLVQNYYCCSGRPSNQPNGKLMTCTAWFSPKESLTETHHTQCYATKRWLSPRVTVTLWCSNDQSIFNTTQQTDKPTF